jgi:hypothetical protein
MERVVPWNEFVAQMDAHAPTKATGRPPFPIETMLRMHLLQQCFGLSDVAMEEALDDVALYREFAGQGAMIRLPDRGSILRFRHLLEQHRLAEHFLATTNAQLGAKGYAAEFCRTSSHECVRIRFRRAETRTARLHSCRIEHRIGEFRLTDFTRRHLSRHVGVVDRVLNTIVSEVSAHCHSRAKGVAG